MDRKLQKKQRDIPGVSDPVAAKRTYYVSSRGTGPTAPLEPNGPKKSSPLKWILLLLLAVVAICVFCRFRKQDKIEEGRLVENPVVLGAERHQDKVHPMELAECPPIRILGTRKPIRVGMMELQPDDYVGYIWMTLHQNSKPENLNLVFDDVIASNQEEAAKIPEVQKLYECLWQSYSYFLKQFGRRSFNGCGSELKAYYQLVDYDADNKRLLNADNAFSLTTGELDAQKAPVSFFAVSEGLSTLEIIAHEYTHSVTGSTIYRPVRRVDGSEYLEMLVYAGESGALNEGFSDIFGCRINRAFHPEFLGTDKAWTICGRHLDKPHQSMSMDGSQKSPAPAYYGEEAYWVSCDDLTNDSGGVHTNQMPLAHLDYLLSDGGTDEAGNAFPGIGDMRSGQLFWEVLTGGYLTITAKYADVTGALLEAAKKLEFTEAENKTLLAAMQCVKMPGMPAQGEKVKPVSMDVLAVKLHYELNNLQVGVMPSVKVSRREDNSISRMDFGEGIHWKQNLAPADQILDFLREHSKDLCGSTVCDFCLEQKKTGIFHAVQNINGIEVFGSDAVIVLANDGKMLSVENHFSQTPFEMDISARVMSLDEASKHLAEKYPARKVKGVRRVILDPAKFGKNGFPRLTWEMDTSSNRGVLLEKHFIDAESGDILLEYPLMHN